MFRARREKPKRKGTVSDFLAMMGGSRGVRGRRVSTPALTDGEQAEEG